MMCAVERCRKPLRRERFWSFWGRRVEKMHTPAGKGELVAEAHAAFALGAHRLPQPIAADQTLETITQLTQSYPAVKMSAPLFPERRALMALRRRKLVPSLPYPLRDGGLSRNASDTFPGPLVRHQRKRRPFQKDLNPEA